MTTQNLLANEIEVRIAGIAGKQFSAQLRDRRNLRLANQVRAQSLFRLHEKKIINSIGGCARNHRIRAAEREIPTSLGHAPVMIRSIGRFVKANFEPLISEKALVLGDQMRR